jgi:hypothetical protein
MRGGVSGVGEWRWWVDRDGEGSGRKEGLQ